MADKKTIYLIRHGQTDYNKQGIVQGSGIDSSLNELGNKQAAAFFEHYGHVPFQHVYTSALQRTHQSVHQFINKPLGHTVLEELNEISWGDYEGRKSSDFWKQDYIDMVNAWTSGDLNYRIPGGENPLELQARQKIGLQRILNDPHELILVCMHGRAMKSFLCLMLNKPLHEMEDFQHQNLGLYVLDYADQRFELKLQNSTEHLLGFE